MVRAAQLLACRVQQSEGRKLVGGVLTQCPACHEMPPLRRRQQSHLEVELTGSHEVFPAARFYRSLLRSVLFFKIKMHHWFSAEGWELVGKYFMPILLEFKTTLE